ncbi:MAG: Druantia anti-phage system protein DruA [Deltaproteobacteria bacterium]
MQTVLRYRGRAIEQQDVTFIRQLIASKPEASRRALSLELCQAWHWVQSNGALRDAVCRGLLLALHRAGHIVLPEPKRKFRASAWLRLKPEPVELETTPLETSLRELGPLELRQVRRTAQESLVGSLIEHHHYLGYRQPVGEHLKYLVTAGERPIACFCWSSAPRHLAPRDEHIGWSLPARKTNIRFVAYQTRFLILPWVRVPHLASHLLARMSAQLSDDWQRVYAHPIYFTETFVDPERNRGTCYRAANWTPLGLTKGRGKDDQTKEQNRSLKLLLGFPLVRDFRQRLCAVQ